MMEPALECLQEHVVSFLNANMPKHYPRDGSARVIRFSDADVVFTNPRLTVNGTYSRFVTFERGEHSLVIEIERLSGQISSIQTAGMDQFQWFIWFTTEKPAKGVLVK